MSCHSAGNASASSLKVFLQECKLRVGQRYLDCQFSQWRAAQTSTSFSVYEMVKCVFHCHGRKQVSAARLEAEKDGVVVPVTLEDYCIKTRVKQPEHSDMADFYDDDYDLDDDDDDDDDSDADYEDGDDSVVIAAAPARPPVPRLRAAPLSELIVPRPSGLVVRACSWPHVGTDAPCEDHYFTFAPSKQALQSRGFDACRFPVILKRLRFISLAYFYVTSEEGVNPRNIFHECTKIASTLEGDSKRLPTDIFSQKPRALHKSEPAWARELFLAPVARTNTLCAVAFYCSTVSAATRGCCH
ncbi:hypothetical protein PR048_026892 [Dryococelus australis]|uniref:Uncharacterized protein n=1 Tax=Dryococelus australis TaxID=614101 RepID=A0ABQ9GML3_9NEOP|nr:hypothetical protein PR048_026892 [Dryococelus australis]